MLNKITDINLFFPVHAFKTTPCFGIQHIAGIDIYLHENNLSTEQQLIYANSTDDCTLPK